LTNILLPDAHSNPEIFNNFIRGVSVRSAQSLRKLPSPRLLTSHTAYIPGLPKVLYMVRDGRDVLVSYYNYAVFRKRYLQQHNRIDVFTFSEFLDHYYEGQYGHIWDHHVESWLGSGKASMGERLMLVRYEDLKKETEEIVEQVAAFLGIDASSEVIATAVDEASLENARKIEKEEWEKKGLGAPDAKTSFYGAGKKRDWGKYYDEDAKRLFIERSARAFDLAGYEFGEWDS
jgi:hypothetical protein